MPIRVTVERRTIPGTQHQVVELLRELRSKAVRQAGFLSGETVVDLFNPAILMTVTRWRSLDEWQAWERAPERLAIIKRLDAFMQGVSTNRVWSEDVVDAPPAAV